MQSAVNVRTARPYVFHGGFTLSVRASSSESHTFKEYFSSTRSEKTCGCIHAAATLQMRPLKSSSQNAQAYPGCKCVRATTSPKWSS